MNEFNQFIMEEAVQYNIEKDQPLTTCIFRRESEAFSQYFDYLRENADTLDLTSFDKDMLETDIGRKGIFEGEEVHLDLPFVAEAEYQGKEVDLDKPKRSSEPGSKKYYVYTKNDKGNVIKVSFGDVKGGLTAKINDDQARKSFVARHNCDMKKDKTKAGYWACRLPYYAKELGLSGGGKFFW
jgi:hypothetical protein